MVEAHEAAGGTTHGFLSKGDRDAIILGGVTSTGQGEAAAPAGRRRLDRACAGWYIFLPMPDLSPWRPRPPTAS